MPVMANAKVALRGDLLDFTSDPGLGPGTDTCAGVRLRTDHWLLIESGRVKAVQPHAPGDDWQRVDHSGHLIVPGFIDTHVHSPQVDVIASPGTELLDWLNVYTFSAEAKHADPLFAAQAAELFVDALMAHGSTTACVFPTVHQASCDALFAAAHARGMRLIAGKCLMDRHAPTALLDTVASAERDSVALINRWHGQGRLAYAHTVRFAPTSSDAQLALAGRLLAAYPDTYMQTHVAENRDEVRWVAELFPQARSYLDVYHHHRLLGPRSVLAHGIWLDQADRELLAATGAQIAFCPSSNLFLGSGLMDWRALRDAGVAVSIATDVGGGTSLSMLRTLADAYKVQAMQGLRLSAWSLLHAATRGAAVALGLQHEIGSLAPGCVADLAVWRWAQGPVAQRRHDVARGMHERVFVWMTLADERNLVETRVAGVVRYAGAPRFEAR
jgi:guanine deaminase